MSKETKLHKKPAFEDSTSIVPCDILYFILINLPVKSLLRFRSVSAPWNSIISEEEFTKAHRDHSKALGRKKLLLQRAFTSEFRFMDLEISPQVAIERQLFPLKIFNDDHDVLCSHDGLVLLKKRKSNKTFILWNPSIRQQRTLLCPYLEAYDDDDERILPYGCGMCYDSSTDDYKIISIYNEFYVVWSMRNSNCWTAKITLPIVKQSLFSLSGTTNSGTYYYGQGISTEDCVFWSLNQELDHLVCKASTVIYFDVKSDELKVLPKPKFISEDDQLFRLTTLKGCLCLYGGKTADELNIWIMEQDGWKWLMKLCDVPLGFCEHYFERYSELLYCRGNGEIVFKGPTKYHFSIYNPKQQRFVTKVCISNNFEYEYPPVTLCLDSLYFPRLSVMHEEE
ncbi:PREDICTED: F-box/kelch-repeat protein At3g23880-like [Nicotiana attenuata]|uniref:F-boxkelch-repeat protein n=1 Tax=Nicotiana attenuata TaxID=49451 RepID=A0A314KVP0_NICAT|nr:PREDICTED: F-box/kelch-repeat protein At3g23880-like [Nicotiana attenuata]OIT33285.1 f-boxkelch-repeat protein [Nicotiana attenuata]